MKNLPTYEEFLNESSIKLNDWSKSKNKILVGLKTNLLSDLKQRYGFSEDSDMIHFFNKKGYHFATLFDVGTRYQELRHDGKLNDKGWRIDEDATTDPNRMVGTGTYTPTSSDPNPNVSGYHNTTDPVSGGSHPVYIS